MPRLMGRAGRPGLAPDQAERVRALIVRIRDERYEGNATACARALGMTQPALSQIVSRKNRASYATAVALAALLGVDERVVLSGEALEVPASVERDAYPERARALVRLRGMLPPEVEARVRATEVQEGAAFSESEWVELALMRLREHERAEALAARLIVPDRT